MRYTILMYHMQNKERSYCYKEIVTQLIFVFGMYR